MLNKLLHESSVGFAWGVRSSAFLTLGLLIVANLIMTDRLTPPPQVKSEKGESSSQTQDHGSRSYVHEVIMDYPFFLMIAG